MQLERPTESIDVIARPADFSDWNRLLALLREAFGYMDGRIDPPSSLHRLDVGGLAQKADEEELTLAFVDGALAGCLFAVPRGGLLYLGKIAVRPAMQGRGLARRMIALAEAGARARGLRALELQTRIELAENHHTLAALGFEKVGETRHIGFARTTSLTFRKPLS